MYAVFIKVGLLVGAVMILSLIPFVVKISQQLISGDELWNLYSYNSITVLLASVSLFLLFIQREKRYFRLWNVIGKTTFGVFLIHTQYILRDKILWNVLVRPYEYVKKDTIVFVMHYVFSVVLIFVICCIIDLLRDRIFLLLKRVCKG